MSLIDVINSSYSISWAYNVYTITVQTNPVQNIYVSGYNLALFASNRNPDVFYMGPTDHSLTVLQWKLCTSPANADNPPTLQGLLKAIIALNVGISTFDTDVTFKGLVEFDQDITTESNLTVDGTSTLTGNVSTGNALTVGGDLTVDGAMNNFSVNAASSNGNTIQLLQSGYDSSTQVGIWNIQLSDPITEGMYSIGFTAPAGASSNPVFTVQANGYCSVNKGNNAAVATLEINGTLQSDGETTLVEDVTCNADLTVEGDLTVDGTSTLREMLPLMGI
jgi:cytoskeletal protein CcmA (bactofilin family)